MSGPGLVVDDVDHAAVSPDPRSGRPPAQHALHQLRARPDPKGICSRAYSVGRPGRKHPRCIPFYPRGPDYQIYALLDTYRKRDGEPAEFQVLGGLVARDVNYERGTYRYRILWGLRIGRRRRF
jgi:hypothetical protein